MIHLKNLEKRAGEIFELWLVVFLKIERSVKWLKRAKGEKMRSATIHKSHKPQDCMSNDPVDLSKSSFTYWRNDTESIVYESMHITVSCKSRQQR